ncbi:hypothetical protein PHYPO_G00021270 [Pangasianodon hypophthalmus]|uniref:Uncharacterized protein n=1 Tax=Pangasianodon hypophthalmus TaxID=310915 RepID=A0A5N5MX29_PANHP|nr:hypothetical protein PHYPO_G00021270 [Pangasianodon hypophthalmus]
MRHQLKLSPGSNDALVKLRKTLLSFLINYCCCGRCSQLFCSEAAGRHNCTTHFWTVKKKKIDIQIEMMGGEWRCINLLTRLPHFS